MVVKRALEGDLTGTTGAEAGNLWIESTYFHYIDSTGAERRIEGTLTGDTGIKTGYIWLEQPDFHYIDSVGAERKVVSPTCSTGFTYTFPFWFQNE